MPIINGLLGLSAISARLFMGENKVASKNKTLLFVALGFAQASIFPIFDYFDCPYCNNSFICSGFNLALSVIFFQMTKIKNTEIKETEHKGDAFIHISPEVKQPERFCEKDPHDSAPSDVLDNLIAQYEVNEADFHRTETSFIYIILKILRSGRHFDIKKIIKCLQMGQKEVDQILLKYLDPYSDAGEMGTIETSDLDIIKLFVESYDFQVEKSDGSLFDKKILTEFIKNFYKIYHKLKEIKNINDDKDFYYLFDEWLIEKSDFYNFFLSIEKKYDCNFSNLKGYVEKLNVVFNNMLTGDMKIKEAKEKGGAGANQKKNICLTIPPIDVKKECVVNDAVINVFPHTVIRPSSDVLKNSHQSFIFPEPFIVKGGLGLVGPKSDQILNEDKIITSEKCIEFFNNYNKTNENNFKISESDFFDILCVCLGVGLEEENDNEVDLEHRIDGLLCKTIKEHSLERLFESIRCQLDSKKEFFVEKIKQSKMSEELLEQLLALFNEYNKDKDYEIKEEDFFLRILFLCLCNKENDLIYNIEELILDYDQETELINKKKFLINIIKIEYKENLLECAKNVLKIYNKIMASGLWNVENSFFSNCVFYINLEKNIEIKNDMDSAEFIRVISNYLNGIADQNIEAINNEKNFIKKLSLIFLYIFDFEK